MADAGTALVREFVGNAHGDIEFVRAALAADPTLVHAHCDWGGGDWESALGAAAHMGRRDIAELLISSGAHVTLFAAAMLGHLDTVRAILLCDPAAIDKPGPHGISLRHHAGSGGPAAAGVADYLDAAGVRRP